jgi:hypothetical protein
MAFGIKFLLQQLTAVHTLLNGGRELILATFQYYLPDLQDTLINMKIRPFSK